MPRWTLRKHQMQMQGKTSGVWSLQSHMAFKALQYDRIVAGQTKVKFSPTAKIGVKMELGNPPANTVFLVTEKQNNFCKLKKPNGQTLQVARDVIMANFVII